MDGKTTHQLGPKNADLTVMNAEVGDEDSGGVSSPAAGAQPPSPAAYQKLLDQVAADLGAE